MDSIQQTKSNYSMSIIDIGLWRHIEMLKEILNYVESTAFAQDAALYHSITDLHAVFENNIKICQLKFICRQEKDVALFLIGHIMALSLDKAPHAEYAVLVYLYAITEGRKDLHHPAMAASKMYRSHLINLYTTQYMGNSNEI